MEAHQNISITRNTLDCDQSNYSSRIIFSHIPIELGQTGISAIPPADLENPTVEPNMKSIDPSVVGRSSVAGRSVLNIYLFLH